MPIRIPRSAQPGSWSSRTKVSIIVGPLSGSEGIAIRDYSKNVTFVNGCSGALETTYVTPSPTFFRDNLDGSQWMAGLGSYIFNEKKYKKIVTLVEDGLCRAAHKQRPRK
jgi:hypothetical protein